MRHFLTTLCTSHVPKALPHADGRKRKLSAVIPLLVAVVFLAPSASADDAYLNLSGIDQIPGLDYNQRQDLKKRIEEDVQDNFDLVFGADKFDVHHNPAKANSATRSANVKFEMGTDGTKFYYGRWNYGRNRSGYRRDFHARAFFMP